MNLFFDVRHSSFFKSLLIIQNFAVFVKYKVVSAIPNNFILLLKNGFSSSLCFTCRYEMIFNEDLMFAAKSLTSSTCSYSFWNAGVRWAFANTVKNNFCFESIPHLLFL